MPRRANATSYGNSRGNKRGPGNTKGADPHIFKRRMQILAQRAADSKRLERLLSDDTEDVKPADFLAALKECANRGFGAPEQPITGADGEPLTIRVIRT